MADRSSRLSIDNIDDLRASVAVVAQRHLFETVAWVVLPDHVHAVWTLPAGDADFVTGWMVIKAGFSWRIEPGEQVRARRSAKGERGIWQRRFWEHQVRDDNDLQRHVDYVHFDPVTHGHANRASDWRHSSIHRYIRSEICRASGRVGLRFGD